MLDQLAYQVTINMFKLVFFGDTNSKEYFEVILDLA